MPQFGWQPQVSWPQSRSGPWTTSAQSVNVDMNEIGNQSRDRLADAGLVLHVVRQVRQRVALRGAALRRDFFVAAGERHRLERQEVDPLRVVERELDDAADLLVVDAVDDRDDRDDVDAGAVQVLDRAQLHVEEVADAAVRVGGVADAVELQVRVAQTGFGRGLGELRALGELDAVGRRLHAVVADLARVADRVQEVRRHRRLAARELHRHLPARLDRDGVVEDLLDVFPASSSWTNPTWFASMKQGSHIMLQRFVRSTVSTEPRPCCTVELPWLCSFSSLCARMSRPGNTSSRCLKNAGVDRHHVLEVAVDGAVLHHQDLAVALDDRRLDLADLLVQEDADVLLAVEDLLPRLARAGRAERIGLARPAERRLGLLIRLQQRLVRPARDERGVLLDLVGVENTCQMPLAAIDRPFSTYFIGACIERLLYKSLLWTPDATLGRYWPRFPGQIVGSSYGKLRESGHFSADWRIRSRGWAGEGVGWHTRLKCILYVDMRLRRSDHCISLMLRSPTECADHVKFGNVLSTSRSGSVRPHCRTRCLRRRICRAHQGTSLARHRREGAAGPRQPGTPRRVRLRGEHR